MNTKQKVTLNNNLVEKFRQFFFVHVPKFYYNLVAGEKTFNSLKIRFTFMGEMV